MKFSQLLLVYSALAVPKKGERPPNDLDTGGSELLPTPTLIGDDEKPKRPKKDPPPTDTRIDDTKSPKKDKKDPPPTDTTSDEEEPKPPKKDKKDPPATTSNIEETPKTKTKKVRPTITSTSDNAEPSTTTKKGRRPTVTTTTLSSGPTPTPTCPPQTCDLNCCDGFKCGYTQPGLQTQGQCPQKVCIPRKDSCNLKCNDGYRCAFAQKENYLCPRQYCLEDNEFPSRPRRNSKEKGLAQLQCNNQLESGALNFGIKSNQNGDLNCNLDCRGSHSLSCHWAEVDGACRKKKCLPSCQSINQRRCDLQCANGFQCGFSDETLFECPKQICTPKKDSCSLQCKDGFKCAFAQALQGAIPQQYCLEENSFSTVRSKSAIKSRSRSKSKQNGVNGKGTCGTLEPGALQIGLSTNRQRDLDSCNIDCGGQPLNCHWAEREDTCPQRFCLPICPKVACDLNCSDGFECGFSDGDSRQCPKKVCLPKKSSCSLICEKGFKCAFGQASLNNPPKQYCLPEKTFPIVRERQNSIDFVPNSVGSCGLLQPGALQIGIVTNRQGVLDSCNLDCGGQPLNCHWAEREDTCPKKVCLPICPKEACDLNCSDGFQCGFTEETLTTCPKKVCLPEPNSCKLKCANGSSCAYAQKDINVAPRAFCLPSSLFPAEGKCQRESGMFQFGINSTIKRLLDCNSNCTSNGECNFIQKQNSCVKKVCLTKLLRNRDFKLINGTYSINGKAASVVPQP